MRKIRERQAGSCFLTVMSQPGGNEEKHTKLRLLLERRLLSDCWG